MLPAVRCLAHCSALDTAWMDFRIDGSMGCWSHFRIYRIHDPFDIHTGPPIETRSWLHHAFLRVLLSRDESLSVKGRVAVMKVVEYDFMCLRHARPINLRKQASAVLQ